VLAPETLRAGVVSLGASGARITVTTTPIAMGAVIEAATPALGQTAALQLAGVGAAVVGGGGGILCLLVAAAAGPVPDNLADLTRR